MATSSWWASALCESVNNVKPLAVTCGGEELVLFRNAEGQVFALEDRCPHRRVPLSLGCVVGSGLQCGYHGWTFDGASGACTAIPNLSASERVPQRHAARAFVAKESNGFVHVWVGDGEPDATLPSADYSPTGREYTGSAVVSMTHDEYLAVMLDGPNCLLGFDSVQITDFFLGDPQLVNDRLVLDRGAVWSSQILPSQFVADYPLIVRTAVPLRGGTIRVDLLSQDETPLSTLFIGASANRRGTTSLCWRGFQHTSSMAGAPLRWRASRTAGRAPFSVNATIDGSAIAALLVAPSRDLYELRQQIVVEQRLAV